MLWHDVTSGICQLQVPPPSHKPATFKCSTKALSRKLIMAEPCVVPFNVFNCESPISRWEATSAVCYRRSHLWVAASLLRPALMATAAERASMLSSCKPRD